MRDKRGFPAERSLGRAEPGLKPGHGSRLFTGLVSGAVVLAVAFVILVNFSMGFARACGKVPLIKELARLVVFSPSLSAAVENEYVQPIGLEQRENDITAKVEYVIVDQKQLQIFYSLDSTKYFKMDVSPEIRAANGEPLEGYSVSSSFFDEDESNGALRRLTVDFTKGAMPNSIQLILKVHDNERLSQEDISVEEFLLKSDGYTAPDYISRFSFLLEFDPYYTAQGETITLNHTFQLEGQTLTVTTVEIYPTHIRLNLKDHENNTAWLKELAYYLEDERGKRYEAISNGIAATGSMDSPMMVSHRLESSFFSKNKHLILYITGATWLDKEMERVLIHLDNKTIEVLPQGVELEEVKRIDDNWLLTFSAKQFKENSYHQLWDWTYYDEEGNEYWIDSVSSTFGTYDDQDAGKPPGDLKRFNVTFALKKYPHPRAYLTPAYSRVVEFPTPIEIKLK